MNKYYDEWMTLDIDADVLECREEEDGYWVKLSETNFYAEAGGQPDDKGTIDGKEVVALKYEGKDVWHKLKEPVSGRVHLSVDYATRHVNAQIHSASHLICGLINKQYNAKTVAFFTKENFAGCEMAFETFDEATMLEIEKKCNDYILQDLPIEIVYPTREEAARHAALEKLEHDELRAAVIGDIDYNMCGCIHVPSLRHIMALKCLSFEKTAYGYKIYFLCGDQLIETAQKYTEELYGAAHMLMTTPLDVRQEVARLQDELKAEKNKVNELKQSILDFRAEKIGASEDKIFVGEFDDMDVKMFQAFASLISKTYHKVFMGIAHMGERCHIIICHDGSYPVKSNELYKKVSAQFGIRGGGNPAISQGGGEYSADMLDFLKELSKEIEL